MMGKKKPWGVVWITGFPNSGKTSLSDRLITQRELEDASVVRLDGDMLRLVLQRTETDTESARRLLGVSYARLALALARQGHIVIVSAVAMYSEVFRELQSERDRVCVIALDVSNEDLKERDWRSIYPEGVEERKATIVSELPPSAHIVENGNGSNPLTTVSQVLDLMRVHGIFNSTEVADNDLATSARLMATSTQSIVDHWNGYYEGQEIIPEPSSFALEISESIGVTSDDRVLDYGCGNGRDTFFFANFSNALGLDVSPAAITTCNAFKVSHNNSNRVHFKEIVEGDIGNVIRDFQPTLFYARFVLHAMTAQQESQLLDTLAKTLSPDCYLAIECRTIRDPLFLLGTKISATERIFGHYRRFIVPEELVESFGRRGFDVISQSESRGVSPLENDDPALLRLLLRRKTGAVKKVQ
jgi:adenylylsulfate kinase-like enzyme/SAM-dependent methyltransferase